MANRRGYSPFGAEVSFLPEKTGSLPLLFITLHQMDRLGIGHLTSIRGERRRQTVTRNFQINRAMAMIFRCG